jgi:hypothetical protein
MLAVFVLMSRVVEVNVGLRHCFRRNLDEVSVTEIANTTRQKDFVTWLQARHNFRIMPSQLCMRILKILSPKHDTNSNKQWRMRILPSL